MLGHGRPLDWPADHGVLTVRVLKARWAAGKYAWVFFGSVSAQFKVSWGG